jgi:hypothetical protein
MSLCSLIGLCVFNVSVGLIGTKNFECRFFFHKASFLLGVLLIVWGSSGTEGNVWQSALGVVIGYLVAFVATRMLFCPWEGTVKPLEILLHFALVPLLVFYLFPRHIPETDFPLGRPLTLITTAAVLSIHFISHPPINANQRYLYILWFVVHAFTLLLF